MSAGTGVVHSEFNASKKDPVHFLQIWILPSAKGGPPNYGQIAFSRSGKTNQFQCLASPNGREGSIVIRQDASIFASILEAGLSLEYQASNKRSYWLQVAVGQLEVNGQMLEPGDGVSIQAVERLAILAKKNAEFLLFDLV
jgi:redox-sensitive bicupin YhaK (pirin superfamily)